MATSPSLTLLIDTQCPLCLRSAVFLDDLDKAGRLHFQSLYQLDKPVMEGDPLHGFAHPPQDQLKQAMHAVDSTGQWYTGPQAIAQALIRTHAPWTWVGRVLLAPSSQWLSEAVYARIAANRTRWLPPLDETTLQQLKQRFPDLALGPACDCH